MRIRMLETVRPDFPFLCQPGTVLRNGETYEATTNKNGAICGVCQNGERLGVKPGEFEFVGEIPGWLYDLWHKSYPYSVTNARGEY